ncbi:MMPL family transporter [Kitasatospora sp. NPDC048296]|uniref:MMPL family transporter n=1 Tax=Kitasatospora sp. NPDC048296 TaxID=3364048 RepID=UPI00371C567B
MDSVLNRVGRTAARRPWLTIGAWLLAIVALFAVAGAAGGEFLNDYNVPGTNSQKAVDRAIERFPEMGAASADVVWHTTDGTLRDPGKQAVIKAVTTKFAHQPDVRSAADPFAEGGQISDDGRTAIGQVQYDKQLKKLSEEATTRLQDAAEEARKAGLEVSFRGQVVDLASQSETSGAELVGLVAALVILLIAFGSLVAAGLPILVAITGLILGTAGVLIAGAGMSIPTIAPIVAIMLGLGAGIDYALFVVTRFREQLAAGVHKHEAAGRALATAGHAVVFAGATVVAAILGLLLTGVPFIGGMGVAAALTVAATMLSALTLLPAVLGLLGHRVNSVRIGRRRPAAVDAPADVENGRWGRWADRVAKNRYGYSVLALAVIAVLTVPLFSLHLGAPDDSNLPKTSTQRHAYETVATAFGPGWNAPLMIVADLQPGAEGDQAIERLRTTLTADSEVATVTPTALSTTGRTAMLTVVPKHRPQDRAVSDLLHRIREDVAPEVFGSYSKDVYVGGTTAYNTDLSDTVGNRLPWMIAAVLAAATVLLIGMFRAPLVALKAAVMTTLSIGAAFGVLVAIFQWGWGLSLIGLKESVPIMAMVPMLLFAVLFGLSMDYEVFMLSAVKEEYDRSGDPARAIRVGLGGTARVITAAAAIMTVVFLSFVPTTDTVIKMIGIGLAVSVIVDVTVIRLVLAPAVMSILGHAAWRGFGRSAATALPTSPTPAAEPQRTQVG